MEKKGVRACVSGTEVSWVEWLRAKIAFEFEGVCVGVWNAFSRDARWGDSRKSVLRLATRGVRVCSRARPFMYHVSLTH